VREVVAGVAGGLGRQTITLTLAAPIAIRRIRLVFESTRRPGRKEFVVRASTGEPNRRASAIAAPREGMIEIRESEHGQRIAAQRELSDTYTDKRCARRDKLNVDVGRSLAHHRQRKAKRSHRASKDSAAIAGCHL
jgi:hypothetical protein